MLLGISSSSGRFVRRGGGGTMLRLLLPVPLHAHSQLLLKLLISSPAEQPLPHVEAVLESWLCGAACGLA